MVYPAEIGSDAEAMVWFGHHHKVYYNFIVHGLVAWPLRLHRTKFGDTTTLAPS